MSDYIFTGTADKVITGLGLRKTPPRSDTIHKINSSHKRLRIAKLECSDRSYSTYLFTNDSIHLAVNKEEALKIKKETGKLLCGVCWQNIKLEYVTEWEE